MRNGRGRLHGGRSTEPKTVEGRGITRHSLAGKKGRLYERDSLTFEGQSGRPEGSRVPRREFLGGLAALGVSALIPDALSGLWAQGGAESTAMRAKCKVASRMRLSLHSRLTRCIVPMLS